MWKLAAFYGACTRLHSHQECRSIPFCLCALQHGFSVGGVLDGGRSDLCERVSHGSFVCLGLVVSEQEYLSWCFLNLYSVSIVYLLKLSS